jgi:hypothetical protein
MKKIMSILVLAICLSFESSAQKNMTNLVGRWESPDGTALEVVDSNQIFLCYGTDKKKLSSYKFDFSQKPCRFDFEVKDSTQSLSLKSLFLFVDDDLLQWQVFENSRPSNFSSDSGEMLYLRRKKQ